MQWNNHSRETNKPNQQKLIVLFTHNHSSDLQEITEAMEKTLVALRKKCVVGFVGGSDLSKQVEQLGKNGKLPVHTEDQGTNSSPWVQINGSPISPQPIDRSTLSNCNETCSFGQTTTIHFFVDPLGSKLNENECASTNYSP